MRVASEIRGASIGAPWYEIKPANLPAGIYGAFPSGISEAVARLVPFGPTRWYAIRSRHDGKWHAFGPKGVLKTETGNRRAWWRTRENCLATIDLIERSPDPEVGL